MAKEGHEPWLDNKELLPGMDWKQAIGKAIKDSELFVALLSSHSVSKKGFFQRELKKALVELEEYPGDDIFVIPVRLDACEPLLEKLEEIHWADMSSTYEEGFRQLLQTINYKEKSRIRAGMVPKRISLGGNAILAWGESGDRSGEVLIGPNPGGESKPIIIDGSQNDFEREVGNSQNLYSKYNFYLFLYLGLSAVVIYCIYLATGKNMANWTQFLLLLILLAMLSILSISIRHSVERYLRAKDDAYRVGIINFLKENGFRLKYLSLLKNGLKALKKIYGGPCSGRALGTSVMIALFYSSFSFLICWVFGAEGKIGDVSILMKTKAVCRFFHFFHVLAVFLFGLISSSFLTSLYIELRWHYYYERIRNEWTQSLFEKSKRRKVVWSLIFSILNTGGGLLCIAGFISPVLLFTMPLDVSFKLLFLAISIYSGCMLFSRRTGDLTLTLPLVGFLAGCAGGLLISTSISVYKCGLIGSGAALLSFFAVGAPGERRNALTAITVTTSVLLISFFYVYVVETGLIKKDPQLYEEIGFVVEYINELFFYSQVRLSQTLPGGLFLIVLPCINGIFDFISLAASRFLGIHLFLSLRKEPRFIFTAWLNLFVHAALDFFIATMLMCGLALTFCLIFKGINFAFSFFEMDRPIPIELLVNSIEQEPFSAFSVWAMFVLFSTLVPTFIHFMIVASSGVCIGIVPKKGLFAMSKYLDKIDCMPENLRNNVIRHASIYISLIWPFGIIISVLFFVIVWSIFAHLIEPSVNIFQSLVGNVIQ